VQFDNLASFVALKQKLHLFYRKVAFSVGFIYITTTKAN